MMTLEENKNKITALQLDVIELEHKLETKKRDLKLLKNMKPLLSDIERSNRNSIERKKERIELLKKETGNKLHPVFKEMLK